MQDILTKVDVFSRFESFCLTHFKKWARSGLFFVYFCLFKQMLQFFTTNKCEKCLSSIWCRDLNPRPLEHESPLITTRPGLPSF